MNEKILAPIVLFVYNRPEHTKQTIEGLLSNPEAKDSELFVFSDGPKSNAKEGDLQKINQVRSYIQSIKGFKKVYIEESETNRGLANSTIYGCTKIINKYGSMIMMEDDDIPSPYFLSYVNRCLVYYKDDKRIWCVSGYVDNGIIPPVENSVDLFLVNRPSSWGFGTWKRCWDKIIWDIDILKGLFAHKEIVKGYNKWGGIDSSAIMFSLLEGKSSSWSIRYNFAAYLTDSKTILPNKSLIENTGCDGTGTHCGKKNLHLKYFERDVIIPENIMFDEKRNKQLWNSFKPTIEMQLRGFVKKLLSRYPCLYESVKTKFAK